MPPSPLSEAKPTPMTDRVAEHPADRLFVDRWSPRAFAGRTLDAATLGILLEAMRWAPSGSNRQPWRVVWGLRGTPAFDSILACLVPANAAWAGQAAALLVVASARELRLPGKTEPVALGTHAFDAGAAWMSLALQARLLGLVTHAMAGFNAAKAREALKASPSLDLHAVVAVGWPGDRSSLPEDLRARETPSTRASVSVWSAPGVFPAEAAG